MSDTPAPTRSVWPIVLLCAVIFLAGGIVGAGLAVYSVIDGAKQALQNPEEMPRRIARRMQRRLDLTDTQAERVRAIVETHQADLLGLRATALEGADPILDTMRDEIATELGPAGADGFLQHWGRMRDEWAPRMQGFRPGAGPGPGAGPRPGPKSGPGPGRRENLRDG